MADYGEQKQKISRGHLFFFIVLGMFLIVYIFGDAIRKQGLNVTVSGLAFWIVFAIGLWILAYMASRLSHTREMRVQDWVITLVGGGAVLAFLIIFHKTIPVDFKGSIMSLQSVLGF